MAILSSADYPQVRAIIDPSLDENTLPDSILSMDIYQGRAESEVKSMDPDAETRTGEDLNKIKRAVILLMASYYLESLPDKTASKIETMSFSSWHKRLETRIAQMRSQAAALVREVLANNSTSGKQSFQKLFGKVSATK